MSLIRIVPPVFLAVWPCAALAHGTWPDNPYNFLHPSASTASARHAPAAVTRSVPIVGARPPAVAIATADGQAQVDAQPGDLAGIGGSKSIRVVIRPIALPRRLPAGAVLNGNAYRITVKAEPSGAPLGGARPVRILLKWAHQPRSMLIYHRGRWQRLCEADENTVVQEVATCPTRSLGTFLLTTVPFGSNGPQTPLKWLNPYIPMLASVGTIVLTALLLYAATRPDAVVRP